MIELFNIVDCEVKDNLTDCLNDYSEDFLKEISNHYGNDKKLTKKDYITYLEEEIPKKFKNILNDLSFYNYRISDLLPPLNRSGGFPLK